MKTVKGKQLLVGADFAGYPLKEAVVAHLKKKGWEITDVGVTAQSNPDDTENIFHRVGAKIAEGEFERALIFCGTGMGTTLLHPNVPMFMRGWWKVFPQHCAPLRETGSMCLPWVRSMLLRKWAVILRTHISARRSARAMNGGTIFMSSISSQWTNWKRSTMRPTNGTASGWSISAIIR